ncbi:uncharacterized protein CDV56_107569 [Aspergillus thermomutatus]|uniref:Major facilitator superfamily (MFS) profile domain-containing protein n=1 Tax=Aspergillus thermomutatus TaxID=41047 RepID=A0A397GY71_ASPTH|nr:uncharacterized protein CDV56_107569 [Aspergillus thermomutatus]RHZ55825.1 hypothetical protein CDV56_107569 [Aspergillus thermomutatus]
MADQRKEQDETEITLDHEENVQQEQPAEALWREVLKHWRVLLWCLLIFLLPMNFGYENAIVGNLLAMPQFLVRFGHQVNGTWVLSARDQQILNGALSVGVFCAAIITGFLSDAYGRKKAIMIGSIICCAGVMVQYYATSILMLFGGKVVATLGFGIGHSVAPVFVSELAPSSLRGICLALIVSIVFLAARTILPESPTWFLIKDRHDEARKAFQRFNGPHFDSGPALNHTLAAIVVEKENTSGNHSWIERFQQPNLRRTTIVVMTYLAQQLIGVNFIAGYLAYYYALAGVNHPVAIAQQSYTIQVFGNMCSWPLIERVGRRRLIVGGCIMMTTMLPVIGGINILNTPTALKVTVALMTVWGFLYQATLGACAYAIGGEIPSPAVRQKTYALNMVATTISSTVVYQLMPILINSDKANLGGKIAFVFFAPSVPMCFYLFFCLPETRGRSFDELEEMFQARVPSRKFKSYQTSLTPAAVLEGKFEGDIGTA